MADNLENFFKKHLSDETSGEDNWNVPSDGVWENVLPEIQKESGLFVSWKKIILIVVGLVLISLLVIFLLWNRNTNSNFAVAETQDTLQIVKNTTEQNSNINNKDLDTEPIDKIDHVKESRELEGYKTDRTNENDEITFIKSNNENAAYAEVVTDIIKNDAEQNANYYTSEKNIIKATVDKTKTPIESSIIEISELKSFGSNVKLDSLALVNSTNAASKNMMRNAAETSSLTKAPLYFNYKGKIGIGAFFTPTITSTYLTGDMINGIENTSPVFLYSSNYGLELKYHLSNKIAFVFGVGKSEIKSWSKSNVDFNYNTSSEEIMPGGDKSNTSDIPMPTPFGDVATSVTYHFPGSAFLPDGEIMQSVMETHQTIQYLSIPLGVEYKLLGKNRINWIVEGGIRFNKSVIDGSEFTSRILHEGQDMDVVEETQTGDPDFKDIYFNYYIGTGFNYRLRKNLQFNTSFRYLGNIDNVNLQNNMSTNVHEFNLKVGILYLF